MVTSEFPLGAPSSHMFGVYATAKLQLMGKEMYAVDMNGDGEREILIARKDQLLFFDRTGPGGSWDSTADAVYDAPISTLATGDVDGDGYDDVLYGDFTESSYRGGAHLLYGHSELYSSKKFDDISHWTGRSPGATYLGGGVAVLGDVDGDGTGEVALSAGGDNTVGTKAGIVYVDFAPARSATSYAPDIPVAFTGESAGDWSGWLRASGDLDDDGVQDLMVISNSASHAGKSKVGAVYVLSGAGL